MIRGFREFEIKLRWWGRRFKLNIFDKKNKKK